MNIDKQNFFRHYQCCCSSLDINPPFPTPVVAPTISEEPCQVDLIMCILWKSDDFQIEHTQTTMDAKIQRYTLMSACAVLLDCSKRPSLFSGTEQNGTDRNSTLKHGTDQEIPRHVTTTSSLYSLSSWCAVSISNECQKPIRSVLCTLPPQPNYWTLLRFFKGLFQDYIHKTVCSRYFAVVYMFSFL